MYELLDNWISPWFNDSPGLYFLSLSLCILIGFYLLIKGGDWLSDHCSNLAALIGIPPVIIGLTIVSIATSTPELFTSVSALRSDSPGLILGNIIGSNIANIGLILGIALLLGTVSTQDAVSFSQRVCLVTITLVFCAFLYLSPNKEIGLLAGLLLLGFILSYLVVITLHALRKKQSSVERKMSETPISTNIPLVLSIIMLIISTASLWAGADSLVYGSKNLAQLARVPEELIGFTLLAIGTSLPELAASISLLRKGETSMMLGNIVGSNLFNISLIGGLAGIMGPVCIGSPNPWVDYLFLLITTFLFTFWLKGKTLNKKEGVLLLLIYCCACGSTWLLNS